ncbi:MAG TPA: YihY family inner membrane protein [Quisquiliibacterium sp.]|nr:YihY family inner membrane protein [Quisquiliibacterium sp.]
MPDSLPRRARGFALALARQGARLQLPQTAASLVLLSLLALVPVITIAVSLLGALPVFASLRDSVLKFLASNFLLPSFSDTLVRYLNQFSAKASELSALGAAVFFATAFSALLTLDRTLNRIWATPQPRPMSRRLTIYWTFLTLGPLLLAASIAVNGLIVGELFAGTRLAQVERVWLFVLPWLTTLAGLTLLYRLVPNAPVRWSEALAGALAAAVVLELLKRGLAFQVAKLPTYTVVYGAFAALPLFLIWLYLLWLTILAGALLAASIPYWGAGTGVHLLPSVAQRFAMADGALAALVRGASAGQPSVAPGELRQLFDRDPTRALETARLLTRLGYIDRYWRLGDAAGEAERAIWDERWALAPGAGALTLRPLFEALWRSEPSGAAPSIASATTTFDLTRIDHPLVESALHG